MNLVKNFALPFSFSPSTRLSHNMSPPPAGPIYSFLQTLPLPSLPYSVQRWIPGQSPFSTHTEVFAALAAYLAIIFGGQFIMKGSKPYRKYTLSLIRGKGRRREDLGLGELAAENTRYLASEATGATVRWRKRFNKLVGHRTCAFTAFKQSFR